MENDNFITDNKIPCNITILLLLQKTAADIIAMITRVS